MVLTFLRHYLLFVCTIQNTNGKKVITDVEFGKRKNNNNNAEQKEK